MNLEKTIENLNKHGIETFVVGKVSGVIEQFCALAPKGSSVGNGGSMSVENCGLLDYVQNSGDYNFVGRNVDQNTEYYLCSSNAVTESGTLYNVDGRSNRITNIAYGPKHVIMIVGINKLVKDLDEAVLRVKTFAAPKNCVRLHCDTPCAKTGKCISLSFANAAMTDGCNGASRICCNYLVSAQQRTSGRIKIIFVKEELGY